jgi:crotonobetainyl-CoA hydratase
VIAAVNGFAMGGGTEIALACDLVVASERATFGLPEVTRGLFAAAGGVIRLQRQIPAKLAAQLVLTGDPVDAATAHQWGLVNEVVAPGQVVTRALNLASRIAANAPLSVQRSKRVLHQTASAGSDWNAAWNGADPWEVNADAMEAVFRSADAAEGSAAFAQKRDPVWTGH